MRIWIITPHFETGKRLGAVLYSAGFTELLQKRALPEAAALLPEDLLILYPKQEITETMRQAKCCMAQAGCRTVLLLNPDQYARHLDLSRTLGIPLLLMPVACQTLLEAVQQES